MPNMHNCKCGERIAEHHMEAHLAGLRHQKAMNKLRAAMNDVLLDFTINCPVKRHEARRRLIWQLREKLEAALGEPL